jgi:ankyrin repeat protein
MSRRLSPTNLETLKTEAKRWLRALRAGGARARERLRAAHPGAPARPGLRDVQHALAREHGLGSWAALKDAVADRERARRSHGERAAEFLELACLNYGVRPGTEDWDPSYPDGPERRRLAARILDSHPEVGRAGIHAAAVCGDLAEVERVLAERPRAARETGGPWGWEPLLYVCFGRLPIPAAGDNAVAIARALLDHGADPNVSFTDGENHFTPLTGAIGEGERPPEAVPPHPQAEALVRLLLERGADPHDRQALYNGSLWHDDARWLDLLYAHATATRGRVDWNEAGEPTLDHLLGYAVARNHLRRAEWLLEHGANPDLAGRYGRRSLHERALLGGLSDMAALLLRYGAQPAALEGLEAFQAACLRLDRRQAQALLDGHPEFLRSAAPLRAAAEHDRAEAAALLLDLGTSPDVEGSEQPGHRALHTAAARDSPRVASLLIERGAEVDPRESRYGGTPLGWALHNRRRRMVELLGRVSRDVFGLAASGNVERLRQVLSAAPERAREVRGGLTPLFHLPEDEDRAVEIVELLLAHGADPAARDEDGRTAADHAGRQGLDAAADRLRPDADAGADPP